MLKQSKLLNCLTELNVYKANGGQFAFRAIERIIYVALMNIMQIC